MNKEKQIRDQAMAYALRIAEKYGIEGLKEEISQRGINNISILAPAKEMMKAKVDITERVVDLVSGLAIETLINGFDFTPKQTNDFYAAFQAQIAKMLIDSDVQIQAMMDRIERYSGLRISVRKGLGE